MATSARTPLDPYPDELYGVGDSVGLALVSGLHRLSARERAVIALTEVAGFPTAEVAEMLETTEGWVERTRRLARGALDSAAVEALGEDRSESGSRGEQLLAERLQAALEDRDHPAIAGLLAEDAALSCTRRWAVYRGRQRVARILCERMDSEGLRLVPTRANGQPAFGCYAADDGSARGMLAVALRAGRVATLTRFWDNGALPYFGLPDAVPAA